VALLHAQMLALAFGERIAMHQMRAEMHHYVKGLPGASHFRREANRLATLKDLRELVVGYARGLHVTVTTGEAS